MLAFGLLWVVTSEDYYSSMKDKHPMNMLYHNVFSQHYN